VAENEDGQEKTEEPTQRRLDKAKEDGDVLSSKETFVLATTLVLFGFVPLLQVYGSSLLAEMGHLFHFSKIDNGLLFKRFAISFWNFIMIAAIVGVPIVVLILLTQIAVGGTINFSAKGFAFKGSKINPIKGLQRIFSIKGLVELLKSLLKVTLLGGLTALVVYSQLNSMLSSLGASFSDNFKFLANAFYFLIFALVGVLSIIAAIDYFYSRHSRLQKLRMSRQDLKDENKQTEGSPEVKSKIRRLQMEASQRARSETNSIDAVDDATAIITNPTHFAVALKFVPGAMAVPVIVSMGRGRNAEKIIEKGVSKNVTVFSSPLLARALYFTSNIGQEIDSRLYGAVAAVLAYIIHTDQGIDMQKPIVDVPKDLQFNEFGRSL
jgi:flagellar biosynthetic protein FlhB